MAVAAYPGFSDAATGKPSVKSGSRPNIIFILADDLGYGDVGFNGQTKIKTPNLDQMSRDGAVMTNFYAGAPVCGPSRVTLLYGQHTGHAPIRGNPLWTKSRKKPVMKLDDVILPKELKRAGYSTAVFGKWAMNEVFTNEETGDGTGHPFNHGFDEFVGFNTHGEAHQHWPDYVWDGYKKIDFSGGEPRGNWKKRQVYADDVFTEKTVDFIERKANTDSPFFVYLNYVAPHKGYTAPDDSKKMYEGLNWPVAKGRTGHYENDVDMNTAYAGMISRMDHGVGTIMSKLKELNIADNTLVFFTSDNGHEIGWDFFNSGGPLRGKKRSVTDGGIRAATVAVWPEAIQPGSKIDTSLAFWDVLPTFCEMAGITPVGETDGISFLPALQGDVANQQQHEFLYWEFNEMDGPLQAIRFREYKAMRYWDTKKRVLGPVKLYNIKNDLSESKDLAKTMPELANEALKMINSARTEHPEWTLELRPRVAKKRAAALRAMEKLKEERKKKEGGKKK